MGCVCQVVGVNPHREVDWRRCALVMARGQCTLRYWATSDAAQAELLVHIGLRRQNRRVYVYTMVQDTRTAQQRAETALYSSVQTNLDTLVSCACRQRARVHVDCTMRR